MLGLEDPGNHKFPRIAARNRIRSEFIPIDSDGVQLDRLAQSGVSLMHVSPASSFSKTLVPSLRISYMVLPPALIERYLATMTFYSCTVSGSDQYVLARFIQDGYFEPLERLREGLLRLKDCIAPESGSSAHT